MSVIAFACQCSIITLSYYVLWFILFLWMTFFSQIILNILIFLHFLYKSHSCHFATASLIPFFLLLHVACCSNILFCLMHFLPAILFKTLLLSFQSLGYIFTGIGTEAETLCSNQYFFHNYLLLAVLFLFLLTLSFQKIWVV